MMEKQKREHDAEEHSDDEITYDDDSDEEEGQEYCYGSVPVSNLQPRRVFSKAIWIDKMGLAEVEVLKGSIWGSTGIIRRSKVYCSIEEVLYLMELGAFALMDDTGAITSIAEVYRKLADEKNGCCWDYFQAYKQLKSLGYIVKRHGIPWSLKNVSGINETFRDSKSEDDLSITGMLNRIQIGEARPVFDVYLPNSKFRKSCPGDPSFVICFSSGHPPAKETVEVLERRCGGVPLKCCHVEQGRIGFFAFENLELPLLP